jgi:heat shock protein HslJ
VVLAVLVAALAVMAAGCSWTENDTRSATQGLPDVGQALRAQEWVLDPGESSLTATAEAPITLVFDTDDALSGSAPCNSYTGNWSVDDHTLDVGPLATTFRTCGDQADTAEAEYLAALEGTHTVDVTDRDRLVLTRAGQHLEYTKAER